MCREPSSFRVSTRSVLFRSEGGSITGSYLVPILAGLVVVGALSNLGDAVHAGLADKTSSTHPTPSSVAVGNRYAAANHTTPADPVAAGIAAVNGASPKTPEPADSFSSFASSVAAVARETARELVDRATGFDERLSEQSASLSMSYQQRNSSFTVEFPGRLAHEVRAPFSRLEAAERNARLNELDRQAWASRPLGEKPVAAWNHGDAVSSLLEDFILLPGPLETLLELLPGQWGGSPFALIQPNHNGAWDEGDAFSAENSYFGPIFAGDDHDTLSLMKLRQLQEEGLLNRPTAKDLQTKLDRYAADADKLRKQLEAMDALEASLGADLGDYHETLSARLEELETLEVMLTLEHARLTWDETNEEAGLDPMELLRSMGPEHAEGALADIRKLYLGGGEPDLSPEELLLAMVGTDLHDKSVQHALNKHQEAIRDNIDRLEDGLSSTSISFSGLGRRTQREAQSLIDSRKRLRDEYVRHKQEYNALLTAHEAQHAHGTLNGLNSEQWREYSHRAEQIRSLTQKLNQLSESDVVLRDRVASLNQIGTTLADNYRPLQPRDALGKVADPEFFSSQPAVSREVVAYDDGRRYTIRVVDIGGKPVEVDTARAYRQMATAAQSAGVGLEVVSGHRSHEEQQYLYNCYQTGSCNNGNLAARPGYSNHQSGHALDLNSSDRGSAQYQWLAAHAHEFGFFETVAGEPWHWEYQP